MKREIAKIRDLKPAEYNPRKITEEQYKRLKKSIKEFGCVRPIVVNKDNTIIGGHQTLRIAKELGHKEVDVVRVDINKQKEKLLNIALNKHFGSFDEEALSNLLSNMDTMDLSVTGFSEQEIKSLVNDFDYSDLTEEMGKLEEEESECVFWNAKFKNAEDFEKVEETIKLLKRKNNLSKFTSDDSNAKILKILCGEYESSLSRA